MTRRGFLGLCAGGAIGTAGGAAVYARHIEPGWLRTARHTVPLPGLTSGLRIAHLSDFHASDVVPLSLITSAIDRALAEEPDLICLTGDYLTGRLPEGDAYRDILARLPAAAPTFAIFGNHDGGSWAQPHGGYPTTRPTADLLRAAGIHILDNDAADLTLRDQPLRLVGVGDLWADQLNPGRAFNGHAATPAPVVLMSHNPDSKSNLKPYAWDLMLCGHTHGGQLRLPLLGTPFAPVRDHTIVDGLHRWNQRWIHVTRGVGNLHGIRFNCRPETSILHLIPTPQQSANEFSGPEQVFQAWENARPPARRRQRG